MDFSPLLKTICPWIATAIAGPLGGLAVDAATSALGLSDKTTEGLKQALSGVTPEQMLALKTADQKFQTDMQALGFKNQEDLESIAAGDRASARDMQKTTKSWVPSALAVLVTAGFVGILTGTMTGLLHVGDSQAMLLLLGSLTTGWGTVMAYYFGSTASSATKTDIIARSSPVK